MLQHIPARTVKILVIALLISTLLVIIQQTGQADRILHSTIGTSSSGSSEKQKPKPHYKPKEVAVPPPIRDPFPLLANTQQPLPPIPQYNVPRKDLYKEYGLGIAPPLLIGFTRSWPMLLQTVVSYITAGWPAEQIYVVENTGVHRANKHDQLTLQHPRYLNHTSLQRLGVNIIQTPVLLTFAQLQNFYLSISQDMDWPYYFWSHMDVLALSHENGFENLTVRAGEEGYKTVYALCLEALRETLDNDHRWGARLFAYDHLTLQNPKALEDVGGWDTLIPFYMTDCDMYSRFAMRNWTQEDRNAGVITDTASHLHDLVALYHDPSVVPAMEDPNPMVEVAEPRQTKRDQLSSSSASLSLDENIEYWKALLQTSDHMFHHKHGGRGRNTWQDGQRGGYGEPYYYDAAGFTEALEVLTEAGKEVYRRKWGHQNCDLIGGGGLRFEDQWLVEKDY
ncbi:hypothetical protein PFICI_00726 [Pestalotiopsis fici W106-1]|uniref:Glycosyl transferase family 8 protein n=1 Tax=Pestalotiopsis fici (strain W106-1 / CGMCC3.15140) TaxID=1229662 RepID=W3XLF2_PESFW|nr:uncharacterized protein PFICI_00726 [Pestalotiopsis fici W106-1]ETS86898.1 hypothetical protein PFICI_00726 [Pestalotiopsis fici W106-1]